MWVNVPFPPRIAMGIGCKPGWEVTVITTLSGRESRNLEWADARHEYDGTLAVRTETDYADVISHFHMMRGMTHSFPLKDPLDHRVDGVRGVVLEDADGSPPFLQLHKVYGSGDTVYYRRITRPMQGKVVMTTGGTPMTEGVDYTIDYDTGIVTLASADPTTVNWTGQFWVPVRYDMKTLPARVTNRRPGGGDLIISTDSIPLIEVRDDQ